MSPMELEFRFSLKQKEGKGRSLVSVREELVSREEISPSLTTRQTALQGRLELRQGCISDGLNHTWTRAA